MIGWVELEEDAALLHDVQRSCRLETYKLDATVPSEKALQELAWSLVAKGFRVNLNSRTAITAIIGKNDERTISVTVRSRS